MDQDYINAFEAVLSDRTSLADDYIKMTPVPVLTTGHYGRLTIEDNSKDNYEIIKFTSVDALGVHTWEGGARNEDGNSTGIHAKGVRVRMNVTAQDLEDIRDHAQNVVASSGNPVLASVATTTTLTPTLTDDINIITALASSLVIDAPVETPRDMQVFQFRIDDNGTAQSITWNPFYEGDGVTLPTTTTVGKTLLVAGRYYANKAKIHILAVAGR